ncbi:BadF/BadG/BcrA/BcrD ATPase family protein [Streptomyces sp. GC420]|uniref:N-acetylglucosamine kinase n=1 Tax=Streptomyces sp. GC420 TaxID=2697568 RepID=UPI001414CF58|nr:BadF/BadG/BcrA/BcrD ATPase family protein [Streptomyces sp. GC420]NBM14619.1 ATPase [Streptomyces sp. GC420]
MSGRAPQERHWVLGVDSGGSGLRVALAAGPDAGPCQGGAVPAVGATRSARPVRTGPGGIDAAEFLDRLLPAARELMREAGAGRIAAIAVGAAGMATLGGGLRSGLPGPLARELGARWLALAADAVTAYAGALGPRPGVVVAAGTGLIALGTDLRSWRRADGWGHLLGDCGSGAWIGRAGLEAALRAHDGRRGGSRALLARTEAVLGPAAEVPGLVYPRSDRPAVLASFAPEVARAAAGGDTVADRILREAAGHIADAAAAACPDGPHAPRAPDATGATGATDATTAPGTLNAVDSPGAADTPGDSCTKGPAPGGGAAWSPEVALTGGLLKLGDPLLVPLRAELARQLPHARLVPAAGDPLRGAVVIASALATGDVRLPVDGRLLHVRPATGTGQVD